MRMKVAAACIAAVLLAGGPAWAHNKSVGDPDDVNGPLDIQEVSLRHGPHNVFVKFTTYGNFGPTVLSSSWFDFRLKRPGSQVPWYYVMVSHENGAYRARLVPCGADSCHPGNAKALEVTKPSTNSIEFAMPRSMISNAGSKLHWFAWAGDGNIVDRAPATGTSGHFIGAAG